VAQASTIRLTNLSGYEANLIRLNLQGSLNMFLKISKVRGGWLGAGGEFGGIGIGVGVGMPLLVMRGAEWLG